MHAIVLVGPPGVGKSTYATKLAKEKNAVILSGDSIRESLYGNAANQGDWGEIWNRIEDTVSENAGRVLIFDGTNCRKDYRKETLTLLQSYGYTDIEAIVFRKPLEVCLRQNSQRDRQVPDHVITQMFADLERSVGGISAEGFSCVTVLS